MTSFLQYFILIPIVGFLLSLFVPKKKEGLLSGLVIFTLGLTFSGITIFGLCWWFALSPVLDQKVAVLFKSDGFEIVINFFFDKFTLVFAFIGALLALAVAVFSKFYMHREEGFKRYFTTLILFFSGYNILVFSGNFETLFIGWEILGITSFLLIAFYRDRYLPVKNGLKVISVYRLADICLMLAMWMSHHTWHENITFLKLGDTGLVADHIQAHSGYAVFIAMMILIAAVAKSAQFPFSSWLPRAMEGPTTSTSIFYGSLSVHIGAFLLLRTYPYWENLVAIKVVMIGIGVITSLVATNIALVQSSVKTQIAYASIAQIGLIFIEIALGFHILALVHFAGNAMLRTYQLLVSPSVLSYAIHDMYFNFNPKKPKPLNSILQKISNSLYVLSLKEWNMDFYLQKLLWNPFKWVGHQFGRIKGKWTIALFTLLFLSGVIGYVFPNFLDSSILNIMPVSLASLGLVLILQAFSERGDVLIAWFSIAAAQLFFSLSIALHSPNFDMIQILIFSGGSLLSAIVGFFCLIKIKSIESTISLGQFHGYIYEYPKTGFFFLVACLGIIGLPFTPTFIGIDLLFSHIGKNQVPMIVIMTVSYLLLELSILRIYSRIFLGIHKKAYHAIVFRSS